MALQCPIISTDDLRAYHAKHFPHALPPEHFMHGYIQDAVEDQAQEEIEDLGYYPDGTKRTITDEEIAYLRYVEIRAILRKRRQQQAGSGDSEDGEISPQQEDSATPASASNSAADKVITGRIEKPAQQKWTTSSARTKARNKRNRNKYRAKKKEEGRLIRERANRGEEEADESDEWDPWHQATGPDAQKDEKVDLDY